MRGTAAPIPLMFRNFVGAKTGRLLPTGVAREVIDGIEVSLVDSAMPMMLLDGRSLGLENLTAAIAAVGPPCSRALSPSASRQVAAWGSAMSRHPSCPRWACCSRMRTPPSRRPYLTPWALHQSLAVTGGICIATAVCAHGTIAESLASPVDGEVVIAHPAGLMPLLVSVAKGRWWVRASCAPHGGFSRDGFSCLNPASHKTERGVKHETGS